MKIMKETGCMSGRSHGTISKERHLLTCYCKHGMIEEAKVYGGLEENACAPNAMNFQTFLQYLCRNEDFDMGFEVFKESVRRDKIPDFETMKHLVEGLVKNSKLKEAKRLIKMVNRKFPTNFLNAWKKLEMELDEIFFGKQFRGLALEAQIWNPDETI
ncbi:hypothetical protein HHK36_019930 [Tetracentron sinense]|uniref:Pentatricopeptide repeat-containing protein n=1 Tax=Tetracentron sinense TaxID=13715 RepID=A0A834YSN5_TETSI|nr:hypothetical protein HHK36_019930 [Tetracentron sinense]